VMVRAGAAWGLPSGKVAGLCRMGAVLTERVWLLPHGGCPRGDRGGLFRMRAALAGWGRLVPHGGCPCGRGRVGVVWGLPSREVAG
jgi:hypothetical protein